ncbi:Mitochondrial inner membrane protease atp23 [Malassezia yamatoensis]|uniref:Mitochondrial inner membrane protease ATP23 n=1 Tax=Malassezia yamatoensis TaxID=253288 RepID=A0AAJ6CH41_9BASI|nr:Mitochondrial inner membrane protease atp23 [Malassezia yamatoensis]
MREAEEHRALAWWKRVSQVYRIRSVVDTTEKAIPDAEIATKEDTIAKQRVEKWRDDLLRSSPMVRFMVKHLTLIQCDPITPRASTSSDVPPKLLIASCPPDIAGGFSPSAPGRPPSEAGILLCANRIYSKAHLEDTLAHEMVHWWDHCRFRVDWTDLRHHACSEIRAATLSGDCRWTREINRHNYSFLRQLQKCARRRAILSVRGNANCPDEATAAKVVDDVWDSCFHDTRPFDEIY